MELDIKHLVPYLPYNLKLQYNGNKEKIGIMKTIIHNYDENHPTKIAIAFNDAEHIWMFKPLLKSMRNLTQEDIINLKLFVKADIEYVIDNPLMCDYHEIQYLLSKHYDIFGLISSGLAIEIW